ncbi:nuclear transport factor 2 family protein [Dactylosporangium sp. CS-033363]|uniref:nuclear transport factor 2 family protein n=1 Tax=Dactylosporangium sp. CS-033363 TaxID=3239935 RepID=UPI003D8E302E
MTLSHQELFQRYIYAGAMTRNPTAVADLFTDDGVYEGPIEGLRLEGRDDIERGVAVIQQRPGPEGELNLGASRSTLHDTGDPDVFIAEIDAVLDGPNGSTTVSIVQIFRRDGDKIRSLRDYFTP